MLPLVLSVIAHLGVDPLSLLSIYDGEWKVAAKHSFGGDAGHAPESLVNKCFRGQAYYTCEQHLNGNVVGLVVYTPHEETILVTSVDRDGHATTNTELTIAGTTWTYLTRAGKKLYRVENVFSGKDAIHFTMSESFNDGKTWQQTNDGDETRVVPK